MFHVFEEIALDAVLSTLDTISDFCEYLRKREAFFRRGPEIIAAGEEELLGYYLWKTRSDGGGHDFVIEDGATHVAIDESFWSSWTESRQRRAKMEADKPSYYWDRLIEKFTFHMINGTSVPTIIRSEEGTRGHEISVRWMAREPRVRRRMLAQALIEVMNTTAPGQLRRRLLLPSHDGDPFCDLRGASPTRQRRVQTIPRISTQTANSTLPCR